MNITSESETKVHEMNSPAFDRESQKLVTTLLHTHLSMAPV